MTNLPLTTMHTHSYVPNIILGVLLACLVLYLQRKKG